MSEAWTTYMVQISFQGAAWIYAHRREYPTLAKAREIARKQAGGCRTRIIEVVRTPIEETGEK